MNNFKGKRVILSVFQTAEAHSKEKGVPSRQQAFLIGQNPKKAVGNSATIRMCLLHNFIYMS
jgi:hypothetical protein